VSKLAQVYGTGLYVNRPYEFLQKDYKGSEKGSVGGSVKGRNYSPEEVIEAVAANRKHIAELDKFGAEVAKKAGIAGISTPPVLSFEDHPWKTDDANWFKDHPARSHRLRAVFPGEDHPTFTGVVEKPCSPGWELQVLVRQIEPGKRVRMGFLRCLKMPVPDNEAFIHAMFDFVAENRDITAGELLERVLMYQAQERIEDSNH
jgi:hypothetical protein